MENWITIDEVAKIWTIPGKKPPCTTTLWRRRRQGKIPEPKLVGNTNVYDKKQVIALRNKALGIED